MKVGITLKKELKEPILKEVRDGNFSGANDFINHVIEKYFQNKNKKENFADIDEVFKVKDNERAAGYIGSKYIDKKSIHYNLNESERSDHYHIDNARSGLIADENIKFSFDLFSSDLNMLHTLEPDGHYEFQELNNQSSMLFGQINRYLAIKSALYITALALKENHYNPISHDTDLIKDLSFEYANKIKDLGFQSRSVFGTNISIGLPRVVSPTSTHRYRSSATGNHLIEKSIKRYIMQYFWNIRRIDKKVDGVLAKLGFVKVVKKEDDFKIHLTKAGIEFLRIKNNVIISLEKGLETALGYEKKLHPISQEETEYILNHVEQTCQKEHKAMIIILQMIADGNNTPAKLEVNVNDEIFGDKTALIDMNRNGVVARLTELRLIDSDRKRQSRVEYLITDLGKHYLKNEREN